MYLVLIMASRPRSRLLRFAAFPSRGISCVWICALLVFSSIAADAAQKQKLEKNYKDWLERDVAYVITKQERDTFLRLASDEARDSFINSFWELRNPTPGSPENRFKDEVYQRIAYANAHFSIS